MSSLLYLVAMSAKNRLLDLRRHPSKLIAYLVVFAMLAGLVFLGSSNTPDQGAIAPLFWVEGILFLLIALFAGISVQSGLSSGNTFFEMCDVNLLFVSPLSPRSILLYGIAKLMKTALLASFFLLFQSSSLAPFGIRFGGILTIAACFAMVIMVLTILSLLVYSRTSGSPARKRVVRVAAAALFVPLLVAAAMQYFKTGDILQTLAFAAQSPLMRFFPLVGWAAAGIGALLAGNYAVAFGFLAATAGLGVAGGLLIVFGQADYYEDVLCATETAFEKKRAIAEGNVHAATAQGTARRIKVAKTGLGGQGAAVFLYKHLRESFRENRFGAVGLSTVLMAAGAAVMAAVMPWGSSGITILSSLLWMQIIMVGTGQGLKETYLHYIYLVPESAFSKLVWGNLEKVVKTVLESVLIFLPSGLIAGEHPVQIVIHIAVYTLFVFALLGINFASMRWLGADLSAGLLLTLYLLIVAVLMAPGIALAIFVGIMVGGTWGMPLGLLVLAGWELLLGLISFWVARSILHNCDMPVLKTMGNK